MNKRKTSNKLTLLLTLSSLMIVLLADPGARAEYCPTFWQQVNLPELPAALQEFLSREKFQSRIVNYEEDPAFTSFYHSLDSWMELPGNAGINQAGTATLERVKKYRIEAAISRRSAGKVNLIFELDTIKRLLILNQPMGPAADVVQDIQALQLAVVRKFFQSFNEKELSELTIEWRLGRNAPMELPQSLSGLGFNVAKKMSRCSAGKTALLTLVGGLAGVAGGGTVAYHLDDMVGDGADAYENIPLGAVIGGTLGAVPLLVTCVWKTRAGGFALTFKRAAAKVDPAKKAPSPAFRREGRPGF